MRLFLGFLLTPALLSGEPPHLATLFCGEHLHATLTACFATLAPHSGHNLGNQAHAHRNGFSLAYDGITLTYGFQNHAPGILGRIKPTVGAFGWRACSFWHMPSMARIAAVRQEAASFSNCTTTESNCTTTQVSCSKLATFRLKIPRCLELRLRSPGKTAEAGDIRAEC